MPFPPLLSFLARAQCGGKGSNPLSSVGPGAGGRTLAEQVTIPHCPGQGQPAQSCSGKGGLPLQTTKKTPCQPEIGGNRDCPGLSLAVQLHIFFSSDSKHWTSASVSLPQSEDMVNPHVQAGFGENFKVPSSQHQKPQMSFVLFSALGSGWG